MDLNKISIIIPVFNSELFLFETLESIKIQSFKNFECICVDDGSTDNSLEILKDFAKNDSRFIIVNRPHNLQKGGNSCRNYGFKLSSGEFIQWFDSDDLMDKDFLKDKYECIINSNFNYVISRTGFFYDSPATIKSYSQKLSTQNIYIDFLTNETKFFTPGPLFRRSFLKGLTLFDLDLKRHQEKEFFFRVILKDPNYGIIDKLSIFRRMHDSQLSSGFNKLDVKLTHEFICWKKIFRSYRHSNLKDSNMEKFFNKLFLKYCVRFLKIGKISLSFNSFSMLIF